MSGTSPGTGGPFGAAWSPRSVDSCASSGLRPVEPRPGVILESADDRPVQRAVRRSADGQL